MTGKIFRINVKPETIGERGLPKSPVKSAMATFPGVEGDFNRYRHEKKNDDPDMAILLITSEVIGRLNNEGWPVRPGDLGENITARGIPYNEFSPGKSYRIGRATLEITKPCEPCTNLYSLPYVGDLKGAEFIDTLIGRRGWYARVLEQGMIRTGDPIEEVRTDRSPNPSPP